MRYYYTVTVLFGIISLVLLYLTGGLPRVLEQWDLAAWALFVISAIAWLVIGTIINALERVPRQSTLRINADVPRVRTWLRNLDDVRL